MKVKNLRIAIGAATAVALAAAAILWRPAGELAGDPTAGGPVGADWLSASLGAEVAGLERPSGPWSLALPHDHAPHPGARTEVWRLSAHLANAAGAPVGVQLTVLRVGIVAPDALEAASPWDTREIYRAHAAVLDGAQRRSVAEERFGRGIAGVAGFDPDLQELRLDDWAVSFGDAPQGRPWRLSASVGGSRVELTLAPDKAPLTADAAQAPFRGYAISRLRVEGALETDAGREAVAGLAWFDHLWGDLPLPGGSPVASDSLQLQFDDGSEVSVLRSRRLDGGGAATVEALLIDPLGATVAMSDDAAQVDLTRHWRGSVAAWPLDWTLRVGDLAVSVTPVLDDQEHAFAMPLWSGLVRAEGRRGERPVIGTGVLQLTGYARP